MDVDEDRCLSIEEIWKLILLIEKNFYKEKYLINFSSKNLIKILSVNTAKRKFKFIMDFDYDRNSLKNEELITFYEFINKVKSKYNNKKLNDYFFLEQITLKNFLSNKNTEDIIEIDSEIPEIQKNFTKFREKIHTKTSGALKKDDITKELPYIISFKNKNKFTRNYEKDIKKIVKNNNDEYDTNKNLQSNLYNLNEDYQKKKWKMKNILMDTISPTWKPINKILNEAFSK